MSDVGTTVGPRRGTRRSTSTTVTTARKVTAARAQALRLVREGEVWTEGGAKNTRFDADDAHEDHSEPELPNLAEDDPVVDDDANDGDFATRKVHSRPADFSLWIEDGIPQWEVRALDPVRLLGPEFSELMILRQGRLEAYASAIAKLRLRGGPLAVGATTRADLYRLLPKLTNAQFGALVRLQKPDGTASKGVAGYEVSKDRKVLVALPAGVVHLGFFTWKNNNDDAITAIEAYPRAMLFANTRVAIEEHLRVAGVGSDASKFINWARAALCYPTVVSRFQAQLVSSPQDADRILEGLTVALSSARAKETSGLTGSWTLGAPDTKRSAPALKRALVGGLT